MSTTIPEMPLPSFASAFTPAAQVGPPKSILLYGDTGTRKTSMVGELVKAGLFHKVLFIDIDNGSEVLFNDPEVYAAVEDGRITILPIDALAPDAFQKVDSAILEVAGVYRDPASNKLYPHPDIPDYGYDLVVLDTLNIAQDVAANHFIATTFSEKTGKPDGLAAWGRIGIWTDQIARLLHNTSRFVGIIAMHPREVEGKTGITKIKPKLSGGAKDTIATIPSVVAYLGYEKNPETNTVELTATLGQSELYDSKNRYKLPNKVHDFSLVKMYQMIDEGRTPAPAAPVAVAPSAPKPPAAPKTTKSSGFSAEINEPAANAA